MRWHVIKKRKAGHSVLGGSSCPGTRNPDWAPKVLGAALTGAMSEEWSRTTLLQGSPCDSTERRATADMITASGGIATEVPRSVLLLAESVCNYMRAIGRRRKVLEYLNSCRYLTSFHCLSCPYLQVEVT